MGNGRSIVQDSHYPITQSPNYPIHHRAGRLNPMSLLANRAFAVAVVTFAAFTDILAYSIAVPVLPDISRRFGASPTMFATGVGGASRTSAAC